MKLNCDLGESFGHWQMGLDEAVMPHIDMANIACGFHAGDANIMVKTLLLAKSHGVEIGAHPGYADLQGFGRRAITHTFNEIVNLVLYQVSAITGTARALGCKVSYVKPHGALYNGMMADAQIRNAIFEAMAMLNKESDQPLALMLLADSQTAKLQEEAAKISLPLLFEAFADRRYCENGALMARSQAGAVLDEKQMLAQVQQLVSEQTVTTESGKILKVQADTLCVHGDNEAGVQQIQQVRALCQV